MYFPLTAAHLELKWREIKGKPTFIYLSLTIAKEQKWLHVRTERLLASLMTLGSNEQSTS